MSDNLRRYRAIRHALIQGYPGEPCGRVAQHLTTLAAFISGIVGSKKSQLPHIASKIPARATPDSRAQRLARWLRNEDMKEEISFLPSADLLLRQVAGATLVLAIDGSQVGRGCCALMIHVIYKGRALPLAWRVRQSPTGHFPEDLHIAVVQVVRDLSPEGTQVVFLGDGAFDGIHLQKIMNEAGWWYACRTSKSTTVTWAGETFPVAELGTCLTPGRLIELKAVQVTHEAYGPVLLCCGWAKGYVEPLYLVSNMASAEEALDYYRKRFRIETFFSDQKSRGFQIHKSHITDPQRLSRLLIASCLAYIWIVYLGSLCDQEGWQRIIHRRKRCDLSLFQLGLRLLEHFLDRGLPIPVQFYVTT